MSLIKDEPTEGESPSNAPPPLSVNESTNQSTVKCEWSHKGACACADGKCEVCQATTEKETDEKDNILTMTPAAALPLNSLDPNDTVFHPPNWENCEEAENTGNASDAAIENVNPVFGPVDDHFADGPIIEEVNPEEIKEEINDNEEAEMQVEASQMAAYVSIVSPLISSHESTRARKVNLPSNDEIIVKSESEEGTMSSQLPIIEQVNPPEAESNGESTSNDENGNVSKEVEIKEEEEGPMIEEVNPDDYPLSPRDGNTNERAEIAIEASQLTVDAFPRTTGNESNVFEPAEDNEDDDNPIIEEVNPDEEIKEEIPGNVEEANEETEMEVEEAGQAEATALSSLSLRRSTRVRKSAVNYAVLPEAEEEAHQNDPNTDTSDSEESDSDESETDSEMETDAQNETEESNPITAGISSDGRHPRKVFPCQYCGKELSTKANAQRHEGTHQSERPRPYLCSQSDCGKAFLSKAELEAHTIIHSGLRPFACATCGAAFNLKSNLKAHQRTHTDERPYTCKVCLMAFKRKQALVTHRLLHSGSKPSFTCVDCGSSFTQKGTLDRHRKGKIPCARRFTPSKSRPFSCTVAGCGKAFKDRKALKIHIRTHSGVKAFKCTVCGGAFGRKSTLKRHSRQFHGI